MSDIISLTCSKIKVPNYLYFRQLANNVHDFYNFIRSQISVVLNGHDQDHSKTGFYFCSTPNIMEIRANKTL